METKSIKALSIKILQGNKQGNFNSTREQLEGLKSSQKFPEFPGIDHPFHGAVEIVTLGGDRLWIATTREAVKLIPEGAVYFLGDEVIALQKSGKEAARAAILVKEVFGSDAVVSG